MPNRSDRSDWCNLYEGGAPFKAKPAPHAPGGWSPAPEASRLSLVLSTYVPVVLAAGTVTLCERLWPHRLDWRPPDGEVRTDLAFMTVVQLAVPPLVGFFFVYHSGRH